MNKRHILSAAAAVLCTLVAQGAERYNFNAAWLMHVGHVEGAEQPQTDQLGKGWQSVTLPYTFNGTEAFAMAIDSLSTAKVMYRKTFRLPKGSEGKKVFIEFEGVRQAAEVWLNGHHIGLNENGAMAFGFDLTPHINYTGDNLLCVEVDNDWRYHERATKSAYQWNDHNFNANYGGISKNVWLHLSGRVYQTLPLWSSLETTGVYVYATDHDVQARKAVIHAESQVKNETSEAQTLGYEVELLDKDGRSVARFTGPERTIEAGQTATLRAIKAVGGLHFWSWGYGYLYTVKTRVMQKGKCIDEVATRTGFRKTGYAYGKVTLNDRVLQLKGFAQRSSNEWPAIGNSMPAWMSDYSNQLALDCNANLFRWMHITPMKQDVESFDRSGMIHAMPAGDAEKDVNGRRWEHRLEVMRDAIIYNRNNPSILFYECGNAEISETHMEQMRHIRDQYDPYGGRAIGSRNMLASRAAEYGGEMLYINKSATKPMWMMEYNRDEGIRRYWDEWSYPYHKEGEGPLFRGSRTKSYTHNQDGLAVENIVRWNEYWRARPGQGERVNSGGAKIIFSDTNTHFRGEKNYRTSGDVDAMRIAKDSYFVHQALWDGWVDTERHHTYIIGHWNYGDGDKQGRAVTKPVYVASTGDAVELFLNGRSLGVAKANAGSVQPQDQPYGSESFLFTFPNVRWEAGTLLAVSRDKQGRELSRHELKTVGKPASLRLKWVAAPDVFRADGADIRIAEIEVVDKDGRRCPLAHPMVTWSLKGEGQWLGGVSGLVEDSVDNRILNKQLPIEAGVSRVMVRSTTKAGTLTLTAKAKGFKAATLSITTTDTPVKDGFYVDAQGKPVEANWGAELPLCLKRGETPSTPSYVDHLTNVHVVSVETPTAQDQVGYLTDDNENTKWTSKGGIKNAWLKVRLERKAKIAQVCIKPVGFRTTSYPLQIYAGDRLVWEGYTPKCLGYVYCDIENPVEADEYTIKMVGPATVKEAFGSMTELAAKHAVSTEESKETRLGIMELELKERGR